MRIWAQAPNKAGLRVPWAYVRRAIARNWHVPPWVVDQAPADEIALELRLTAIEAEYSRG